MECSKKYNDSLVGSLKDPEKMVTYCNAVLRYCRIHEEESQKLLLLALQNIAIAKGGLEY